jgi:hypothetical protein
LCFNSIIGVFKVIFNPGDNHACVQSDDGTLDYRVFNISKEVMLDLAEEITGRGELPGFSKNVIFDDEVTCYLYPLHELGKFLVAVHHDYTAVHLDGEKLKEVEKEPGMW